MKIKIDIISGFLGSGKTTFIKNLINNNFNQEKIAIIENEFGEVSIDTDILKKYNFNIKEIKSGCICCNLSGDFKSSVIDIIKEYSPERILIEPSGIAKLSDVIKTCTNLNDDFKICINNLITIVDSTNAEIYLKNFGEFFKDQIKNAHTIILTKTENNSENKNKHIIDIIKKINNNAQIINKNCTEIKFDEILNYNKSIYNKKFLYTKDFATVKVIKVCSDLEKKKYIKNYKLIKKNILFDTWSVENTYNFTEHKLKKLFDYISKNNDLGYILRGKGLVQLDTENFIEFHYVPGEFKINNTQKQENNKICIIGTDLNKEKLSSLFKN